MRETTSSIDKAFRCPIVFDQDQTTKISLSSFTISSEIWFYQTMVGTRAYDVINRLSISNDLACLEPAF